MRLLLPARHVPRERAGFLLAPGAFGLILGAKVPLLMTHGLRAELLWSGKSLIGALLGAYAAVRIAKRLSGERWTGGGDAVVLPLAAGVAVGRVGCLLRGCCSGPDGFPVPAFEIAFHLAAFAVFLVLRSRGALAGRWFPLYLLAYCVFRFFAEIVRVEPRILGPLTAYQILAVAGVVATAADLFRRRHA